MAIYNGYYIRRERFVAKGQVYPVEGGKPRPHATLQNPWVFQSAFGP